MIRLPIPDGDDGTWGGILNDFLSIEHNPDGTLKRASDITDAKAKADAAVQPTRTINGHALDSNIILTPTDIGAQPAGSYATAAQGTKADSAVQPGDLATVATSGSYTDLTGKPTLATVATTGSYVDLTNKPSIPAAQVNADWDAVSGDAQILNKPTLATVATSGSYTDLSNKPTVPAQFNPTAGTNVTLTGTYPNITFSATPGAGVTDLSVSEDATTVTVISSTGADATLPAATTTAAGVLTAADKTKLDGVAAGATANVNADWDAVSGDAQILNKPTLGTAAAANTTDFATAAQGTKADSAVQPGDLAAVATSGDYTDLTNKPSIPAAQVNADWNAGSGVAQILNKPTLATVATSGSYTDLSGKPTLATVATTGSYTDLTDKPTLGTAAAANTTDFATAAQGTKADSAVQPTRTINGYTLDNDVTLTATDIGAQPAGSYATAAQGAEADTALQPTNGLTVINTGGDANYPRPAGIPAGFIKWISTVAPVNALAGDDGYGW